jgi:2-C-methyl-D-erythritol 4-phosphate cytidylyltransferase
MKIDAIIPAGGSGNRFSANIKKQFYKLFGKEILYYTLFNLYCSYNFNKFIIGISEEDKEIVERIIKMVPIKDYCLSKAGNLRQQTVLNCLLKSDSDFVLIHDAVRPLVTKSIVENLINGATKIDGVICGVRLKDALKEVSNDNTIKASFDRSKFILVHTPQIFKRVDLINALQHVENKGKVVYDEAEAFEYIGKEVKCVKSSYYNIKVTYSEDIPLLEFLIKKYMPQLVG